MIEFIGRHAEDLFEELLDEALPSMTLKGTEYKAGKVYRYMSPEEFEQSFYELLDKCREQTLLVKTRSTQRNRQEIWTNTMSEFVILKRAMQIVKDMDIGE